MYAAITPQALDYRSALCGIFKCKKASPAELERQKVEGARQAIVNVQNRLSRLSN